MPLLAKSHVDLPSAEMLGIEVLPPLIFVLVIIVIHCAGSQKALEAGNAADIFRRSCTGTAPVQVG